MKLFIDTWGWLCLRDKREARHKEVARFYRQFRQDQGIPYTSDYVLDETFTLLFRRLTFDKAKESLELIDRSILEGFLHLEHITPDRFEQAEKLRLKFRDQPRISFTDLTTIVVMRDEGISQILSEDDHFLHVGMGFQKVPA